MHFWRDEMKVMSRGWGGGGGLGAVVRLNTAHPELVSISSCAFLIRP